MKSRNFSNVEGHFFPYLTHQLIPELFEDFINRPGFLRGSVDAPVYLAVLQFRKSKGRQTDINELLSICKANLNPSSMAQTIFAVIHLFNQTNNPDYSLATRILQSAILRNNTKALATALFLSLNGHYEWAQLRSNLWLRFDTHHRLVNPVLSHVFDAFIRPRSLTCEIRYKFMSEFIHQSWLIWDGKLAERNVSSNHARLAYSVLAFAGNPIAMGNLYVLQIPTGNISKRLFDLMPDDILRNLDVRHDIPNETNEQDLPKRNVYLAFEEVWNLKSDLSKANDQLDFVLKWKPEARIVVRIARVGLYIFHSGKWMMRIWKNPRKVANEWIRGFPNVILVIMSFLALFVIISVRIRLYSQ